MKEKHRDITRQDIIDHVTESHLQDRGGYPYDYLELTNGDLIVASLDASKEYKATELLYFTNDEIQQWMVDATKLEKEAFPDLNQGDCIEETWPNPEAVDP